MFAPKLAATCAAFAVVGTAAFAAVDVKEQNGKVRIEIDGELFTEYCPGDSHVYYYPVIGPGGAKMTRSWPMDEVPNEERDHPHQRSLWFAHGMVNGVDFWSEAISFGKRTPKHPIGKILHDKVLKAESGENEGSVRTSQKWVAPDGSVPVTSVQTLWVYDRPANERVFDFEITLTAGEKGAVFGDTKEGTMAMRLAESMRVKQPKGHAPGQGHMVNSEGAKDASVWGKPAKWVDYSGPVNGKTLGVAIFDHPKNPRHPTRWHARDYGLFAANPFCGHEMDKSLAPGAAELKLAAGESVTFRYRFYIHEGDAEQGKVAERYREFAQ